MKKALAILLACVMVFLAVPFATFIVVAADEPKEAIGTGDALWDGSTVDSSWFSAETYAEQTEFHLTSAAQVASLKSVVTTTYTFEGKTIYLDCDVYLNNVTSIVSDTVFTRGVILERIWGFSFDGEARTVDVHIGTLRSKLGECGEIIETVRGIGYKISGSERK